VRAAFVGRTSTDDLQDPTISIPRQLRASWAALPDNAAIVMFFYDIETGRTDVAARGRSRAHEQFAIPVRRDGGIQDLLDEVSHPNRRFDTVVCESVDRIARRTYYGVAIEHALERAGVPLLAADEPGGATDPRGTRATRVLTRRVKQGIAEWYVLDMLEKSRAGFEEHTRQGFNIGAAPYGYQADRVPHPVPARKAEGKAKTRLVPDPVTAPVVAQIFTWRVGQRLSYTAIAAQLNTSLSRYPPPMPTRPARAVGHWTAGTVRGILINPKYTGYMVWNRRATRSGGKVNAVEEWVCSPKPTHAPIISVETFTAAGEVGRGRQGSRPGAEPNRHPAAHRTYLLRSYVFCAICGRRMFGRTSHETCSFACPPQSKTSAPGHQNAISVRQDALLDGLRLFLRDHLLGPNRTTLLAETLSRTAHEADTRQELRLHELAEQIRDLNERRARLVASLEACADPDPDFVHGIQVRMAELRVARDEAEAAHRDLARQVREEANPNLLDLLPTGTPSLDQPEPLMRRLFDLTHLEIHYDAGSRETTYRCTLTPVNLTALAELLTQHIINTVVGKARRRARCDEDGKLIITGRYVLVTSHAIDPRRTSVLSPPHIADRCMP